MEGGKEEGKKRREDNGKERPPQGRIKPRINFFKALFDNLKSSLWKTGCEGVPARSPRRGGISLVSLIIFSAEEGNFSLTG